MTETEITIEGGEAALVQECCAPISEGMEWGLRHRKDAQEGCKCGRSVRIKGENETGSCSKSNRKSNLPREEGGGRKGESVRGVGCGGGRGSSPFTLEVRVGSVSLTKTGKELESQLALMRKARGGLKVSRKSTQSQSKGKYQGDSKEAERRAGDALHI